MYYRRLSVAESIGIPAAAAGAAFLGAAFVALAAQREQNERLRQEWAAYNRVMADCQAIDDAVDHEITSVRLRDIERRALFDMECRRRGI